MIYLHLESVTRCIYKNDINFEPLDALSSPSELKIVYFKREKKLSSHTMASSIYKIFREISMAM
jgi:hypothetical protein